MSNTLGVPAQAQQGLHQIMSGAVVLSALSFMLNSFQHFYHLNLVHAEDAETSSA
jgi:hypothetical protein